MPVSTGPPPEKEATAPAGTRAAADLHKAWKPNDTTITANGTPAAPDGRALIRRDEWADLDWRDARDWEPLDASWCVKRQWEPGGKYILDEILLRGFHNRDRTALHCALYMTTILKLAIDGELRTFVPYIPKWCRTLPDELLFYLAAGSPLTEKQLEQLDELETATLKFKEIKRIARRDEGDTEQ